MEQLFHDIFVVKKNNEKNSFKFIQWENVCVIEENIVLIVW